MPLDDRLKVGSIIFEYATTTNPPKDKYYVIVGATNDEVALGTVYINSEINPNLFRTEVMRRLHIPLSQTENPFLKWDSHIDCSEIYERRTKDVYACVVSENKKYGFVASLPDETLQTVITTLDAAITIEPFRKKKFGIRK